jgi:hypothetical protein
MDVKNIAIKNYGSCYSSDNYGAHTMRVELGDLTFWFSYQTIIAFREAGQSMVVCANSWGSTTGKHLNLLDGGNKRDRLPREKFVEVLNALLSRRKLVVE